MEVSHCHMSGIGSLADGGESLPHGGESLPHGGEWVTCRWRLTSHYHMEVWCHVSHIHVEVCDHMSELLSLEIHCLCDLSEFECLVT